MGLGDFLGDIGDFFTEDIPKLAKKGGEALYRYNPMSPGFYIDPEGPGSRAGAMAGGHTPTVTAANKDRDQVERDARAAADARIAQAEYEEQAAKGSARTKQNKRRGFSSTMLTGGPNALGGSSLADSGKTLLGG